MDFVKSMELERAKIQHLIEGLAKDESAFVDLEDHLEKVRTFTMMELQLNEDSNLVVFMERDIDTGEEKIANVVFEQNPDTGTKYQELEPCDPFWDYVTILFGGN